MKIFELSEQPDKIDKAIKYFWTCWGNESNLKFYENCIRNSISEEKSVPKFYIGVESNEIIASYALLTNDIISRQDLIPWFACLYVDKKHRKKGYAEALLNHGAAQSKLMGYQSIYLNSDLTNFYERKGWKMFGQGFNVFGEELKIYNKKLE